MFPANTGTDRSTVFQMINGDIAHNLESKAHSIDLFNVTSQYEPQISEEADTDSRWMEEAKRQKRIGRTLAVVGTMIIMIIIVAGYLCSV